MYQYQPLPPVAATGRTPPFTRILHLSPGSGEDTLSGHLELINLESAPQYEALSYTWGTGGPSNYIWLGDDPLPIQPNLEAALSDIRHPSQVRRIWIDALCIDQSNIDERSRQVQYMRLVYKHCTRVVVWLGLKTPGVDIAFQAAQRISDVFRLMQDQSTSDGDGLGGIVDEMIDNAMSSLPETAMLHLEELFNRPYFSRSWVVQEIAAGAPSVAVCGEYQMPFVDIASIVLFWGNRYYKKTDPANSLNLWYHVATMHDSRSPAKLSQVKGSIGPILEVLEQMRDFKATDPRDKIYAILGVCDEGIQPIMGLTHVTQESDRYVSLFNRAATRLQHIINDANPSSPVGIPDALTPNYKKDVVTVYTDFARYSISKAPMLLDILSYVQHTGDPSTDDYPSWVPKWFESKQYQVWRGGDFCAGICMPSLAEALAGKSRIQPALAHPRRLALEGFHVGVVQQVSEVVTFGRSLEERDAAIMKIWDQLFPFPLIPRPRPQYRTGEPLDEAFCRAISSSPLGIMYGFLFTERSSFGLKWTQPQVNRDMLEEMTHRCISAFLGSLADPHSLADPGKQKEATQFRTAFALYSFGRRVFITREGHIGLGPPAMRPGDEAVVLFKGRMPYILRRLQEHDVFMGDCYVRDNEIMYGKVTESVRHGRGGPPVVYYNIQ